MRNNILRAVLALGFLCGGTFAHAEKNDRSKPMTLEALKDGGCSGKPRKCQLSGGITIAQGTFNLSGDKLTYGENAAGNREFSVVGRPVQFKEKREVVDDYIMGNANRIEYSEASEEIRLIGNARIKTSSEELTGAVIIYNRVSETYQVLGQPAGTGESTETLGNGKIRIVIQPKKADSVKAP